MPFPIERVLESDSLVPVGTMLLLLLTPNNCLGLLSPSSHTSLACAWAFPSVFELGSMWPLTLVFAYGLRLIVCYCWSGWKILLLSLHASSSHLQPVKQVTSVRVISLQMCRLNAAVNSVSSIHNPLYLMCKDFRLTLWMSWSQSAFSLESLFVCVGGHYYVQAEWQNVLISNRFLVES